MQSVRCLTSDRTGPESMPEAVTVPARVAAAVGRVLDVDVAVLRADTPLADVGADAVALIAMVDLLVDGAHWKDRFESAESVQIPLITTVGDLAEFVRQETVAP